MAKTPTRLRQAGGRGRAATVQSLCDAIEAIAPTWSAAEWDNVGLLAGSARWPLRATLLTIDLTAPVLDEALAARCDAIVAYHPPVFRPMKQLRADRATAEALAVEAVANKVAVYSPHTALDAAVGGTNDVLAEWCGLKETRPFSPAVPQGCQCKLVTFVPPRDVERVAAALFAAGAGRIGDYEQCSFRVDGEGTFFGTGATNPAVGRKGRLERVREVRLEVVLARSGLAEAAAALRTAHPYEEPAFEVYPLEAPPDARVGQGRIGRFARPTRLAALAKLLAKKTGAANATMVGPAAKRVTTGLVCVGAAGSLPFEVPGRRCGDVDVVVTGEIRHHDALRYLRHGACAIALGHSVSERPALAPLAARLRRALPGVRFAVSRKDRDPFERVK